jgi:large exoprotein involved in heme utilization and adhesion
VRVQAQDVMLSEGAQISSDTFGAGAGGTVSVIATDTLTLTGTAQGDFPIPSGIFAGAQGLGIAGGAAGAVEVVARAITITDGAQISSGTLGAGAGGMVSVIATDTLTLTGTARKGAFPSGIFASAQGLGGAAGAVEVTAPTITVSDGAAISSSTNGSGRGGTVQVQAQDVMLSEGAQISSNTSGAGSGGTVTVTATNAVTLAGRESGLFTNTTGRGAGGNIILQVQDVQLTDSAMISARSTGSGNAGRIRIRGGDTILLSGNSAITTEATQADGGNITVTARTLVRLRDSQITTAVGSSTGDGGNLEIGSEFVVLEHSQLTANAFGGRGGNIVIMAEVFLPDPASSVTASSTLGLPGDIRAPVTTVRSEVRPLPQAFAPVVELLRNRCVEALRGGQISSFVVSGRDGVPVAPGGLLPDPLSEEEATGIPARSGSLRQRDNTGYAWKEPETRFTYAVWDAECGRWLKNRHSSPEQNQ